MTDQIASLAPVGDPCDHLGFIRNSDGSLTRRELPPELDTTSDTSISSFVGNQLLLVKDIPINQSKNTCIFVPPASITSISSYADNKLLLVKDVPINQSKNTWIRVFLPRKTLESSTDTKLPLMIFFYGGGFVCLSAASTIYDNFQTTVTVEIPVILVSVQYRLAPEHRLPAAYDDGMEVLHWIKNSEDKWFFKYADFSNTFITGHSAGGNIAYQVVLWAASSADSLKPLDIKGLILNQPFFGGNKRTQSELRSANDKIIPPPVTDVMWELALPIGADRDHEYCNPMMSVNSDHFAQIKALGWKIFIIGHEGDPLFDHQIEFLKMLREKGVEAVGKFHEGGFHGIEIFDPSKCKALCNLYKQFVISCMNA